MGRWGRSLIAAGIGACLLWAAPAQAAFEFPVRGGIVDVRALPGQPDRVQQAVEDTVAMEETPPSLDATLCRTGRVVLTAEKDATLRQAWQDAHHEPQSSAGLFLASATPTQDCRVMLKARLLRRLDESQICHLVLHELGHARGLVHTRTGLMRPTLSILPIEGCEWAWSEWLDG